jgi:hypothetical protein
MARLLCFILVVSIIFSCKPEYKKCEFQTSDDFLKAYNDILNEIITKHSYNIYLGKDEEKIFERYVNDMDDSVNIGRDVVKLHNKLFGDTSRFCTIYLDTSLRPALNPWSYFQSDTSSYRIKIRNLISEFSDNGQMVIDSLNSTQTKYLSQDFKLCIANIRSLNELQIDTAKCYIGKIAFSKLILNNTKDKGLLYYEFDCGGLCGYGSIIKIEKVQNNWKIEQSLRTWIS